MELPVNYNHLTPHMRKQVRQAYIEKQSGKCSYCGGSLNYSSLDKRPVKKSLFPSSFFKFPVHLHHCHKTGMTIGAVHNHCNAILWQYFGE